GACARAGRSRRSTRGLSSAARKVPRRMCRSPRFHCDACKHALLVAFSCKKRGLCPSCNAKRAVKFGEHLYDAVLERVPHPHCGFTIPKRLRGYFRYDRSRLDLLFKAAASAVCSVEKPYLSGAKWVISC